MSEIIYKHESYQLIGICMEVHNQLGRGYSEAVYKDALEYELIKQGIPFAREKEFMVPYKDIFLKHHYYADFIVWDKIILELKAVSMLKEEHIEQTLNYLAVSKSRLGLLVNFRSTRLDYRRVVL
jgi:GxxExxY protein